MSYNKKMIQSNPGLINPLLTTTDTVRSKKNKKFQIGGLVETSSNESTSKRSTPEIENNLEAIANTSPPLAPTVGVPIKTNHEKSASDISSRNRQHSSEEMEEDQLQAIRNRELRKQGISKLDDS